MPLRQRPGLPAMPFVDYMIREHQDHPAYDSVAKAPFQHDGAASHHPFAHDRYPILGMSPSSSEPSPESVYRELQELPDEANGLEACTLHSSSTFSSPRRLSTDSEGAFAYTTYGGREGVTTSLHEAGRDSPRLYSGRTLDDLSTYCNEGPHTPTFAIKVMDWTPSTGVEGTAVTIVLDPIPIQHALLSTLASSDPSFPATFGPGASNAIGGRHSSPSLSTFSQNDPKATLATRHFVVYFGDTAAVTNYSRSHRVDVVNLMVSEDESAFCVLTALVPRLEITDGGMVDVTVQILDEQSVVLEECIVGQWKSNEVKLSMMKTRGASKRSGEHLTSEREAPGRHSPPSSITEAAATIKGWGSPSHLTYSPSDEDRSHSSLEPETVSSNTLRHPPTETEGGSGPQPGLLRTSQIPSPSSRKGTSTTYSNKAHLELHGDLNDMAVGWSTQEFQMKRRLVQFWRRQEANVINATFRPITPEEFVPDSIVISCIFREDLNECFFTSVDTIYLLEAMVGVRFTVEEKNRIRRNLEGFKPSTVSKSKVDSENFFRLIMGFPDPKPRNIEKDVKVFPWKALANALTKIISKYSATYSGPLNPNVMHERADEPSLPIVQDVVSSTPDDDFDQPTTPTDRMEEDQLVYGHQADLQHSVSPEPCYSPESTPQQHSGVVSHYPIDPATSSQLQSRNGSFDFPGILATSSFAAPPISSYAHHIYGADTGTHSFPSPAQTHSLFPSAEDYGVVASDRHITPHQPTHSRSYSDGPRRLSSIIAAHGYGYGYGYGYPASSTSYDIYPPQQQSEWGSMSDLHMGEIESRRSSHVESSFSVWRPQQWSIPGSESSLRLKEESLLDGESEIVSRTASSEGRYR